MTTTEWRLRPTILLPPSKPHSFAAGDHSLATLGLRPWNARHVAIGTFLYVPARAS